MERSGEQQLFEAQIVEGARRPADGRTVADPSPDTVAHFDEALDELPPDMADEIRGRQRDVTSKQASPVDIVTDFDRGAARLDPAHAEELRARQRGVASKPRRR